jgi:SAM-dependent methyltransferase
LSFRRLSSNAALAVAHATQRLSHGWMFIAGGLLRLDDFKRDIAGYFEDYAALPAEIEEGFNPLEARVYQQMVPRGARVLVIGCGTGRDLLPFVAAGHDVVGIEPAAQPVAILRAVLQQRSAQAQIIRGFVEDEAIPGAFDAVIFSPHCYSYIPGSSRRVDVLKKVRAHLNPGGRIIINFLRRTSSWSATGAGLASAVATLSGSDCPWEPHDVAHLFDSPHGKALVFHHYFLPAEVQAEAAKAELTLIHDEVDSFLGAIAVVA